MTPSPRDTGLQTASTIVACLVNGLIFTGMAMAGLAQEEAPPPELPAVFVPLVELPKLGTKPPDPKALPRIVEPKPPPPPPPDEISLSREKEEELEREKEREKKRIEAERKKQEELDRKRKEKEELDRKRKEEADRKRRKDMADALKKVTDPRADDEDAPGFEEGSAYGRSTNPDALKNKQEYIALLMVALTSQFDVPSVIPPDVRRRLVASVAFKVNAQGKVVGEPRLKKSSGDRFFDNAALNAVRKFKPGSQLRLPLPKDPDLRKVVLRSGLEPDMHGKDL